MSATTAGERLAVYLHDEPVGHLWLDNRGHYVFQYAPQHLAAPAAMPLSLSLPLRPEPFEDDAARPFFANLLPEAEIRRVLARRLRISAGNDFLLLKAIGGECAGAVSLLPEGQTPREAPGYRELDEASLDRTVAALPATPLLAGERGIRLSLAGAQDKLPIYLRDVRIFLATGNAPSTHILKPPIRALTGTVHNEAFCMALAGAMGLPVAEAAIHTGIEPLLIVRRYDREWTAEGQVRRLHQEDFCQALGILPDQKYEAEGGPSLVRCLALTAQRSVRPAADLMALLRWVVFNVLVGNADAHAKNLSLLLTPPGPRLAPFYDLLCTRVYESLNDRLAMRIGGENRPAWIQPRHWLAFATEANIKPGLVMEVLTTMAGEIPAKAEATAVAIGGRYGGNDILPRILEVIGKTARKLA